MNRLVILVLTVCLSIATLFAQPPAAPSAVKPFKMVGNIYYVGTDDPTSFLITTPAGHILIDSTFEQTAPIILDSIRALGFKLEDVKILLSSHSHFDHVGGHAAIVKATGAQVFATAQDAVNLESGGTKAFVNVGSYAPVKVARKLKDLEPVTLGGVTLIPHLTPGHTEGNTAWTTTVEDGGRKYNVVFASSMSINDGVHMVDFAPWPKIAEAYAQSFKTLRSLPCDIFLGPHAGFFDLTAKMAKASSSSGQNAFVDPDGYRAFIDRLEQNYLKQIQTESQKK